MYEEGGVLSLCSRDEVRGSDPKKSPNEPSWAALTLSSSDLIGSSRSWGCECENFQLVPRGFPGNRFPAEGGDHSSSSRLVEVSALNRSFRILPVGDLGGVGWRALRSILTRSDLLPPTPVHPLPTTRRFKVPGRLATPQ